MELRSFEDVESGTLFRTDFYNEMDRKLYMENKVIGVFNAIINGNKEFNSFKRHIGYRLYKNKEKIENATFALVHKICYGLAGSGGNNIYDIRKFYDDLVSGRTQEGEEKINSNLIPLIVIIMNTILDQYMKECGVKKRYIKDKGLTIPKDKIAVYIWPTATAENLANLLGEERNEELNNRINILSGDLFLSEALLTATKDMIRFKKDKKIEEISETLLENMTNAGKELRKIKRQMLH